MKSATRPYEEVWIGDRVEECPVLITGERWPARSEEPLNPPPFSKGGGFFPVLLKMHDGNLACALRTGAPHVGSGGEVSICFSRDQGRSWSDYTVVARGDIRRNLDRGNHTLGQAANGDLIIAHGILADYDFRGLRIRNTGFREMEVVRSSDGGQTWSKPSRIQCPSRLCPSPYGQMRMLPKGELVFNARGYYKEEEYRKNPRLPKRMSYLYWSRDSGMTWPRRTLIRRGKTETGFLPLEGDHWIGYVRHNGRPSMMAHSYDGGKRWTRWDRLLGGDLWTQAQRIPGSITVLPNDFVLATYGYRDQPYGVRAIVSRDGGESFDLTREYIISDGYQHRDCGYPSTVSFPDGTVVTVAYALEDARHIDWGTCCIAYRCKQAVFE